MLPSDVDLILYDLINDVAGIAFIYVNLYKPMRTSTPGSQFIDVLTFLSSFYRQPVKDTYLIPT